MPADADALAVAEELLTALRQPLVGIAHHPLGLEGFRVVEDGRVAVDAVQDDDHGLLGGDLVFASTERDGACGAGHGLDVEAWCGGGEAESFSDDAGAVGEFLEVFVRELAVTDDRVELFAGFGDAARVLEQVVDCRGDDAGRGAGSDWHRYDLVQNLLLSQGFSGLGVLGGHHGVQQIPLLSGVRLSVGKTIGSVLPHGF